MFRFVLLRAVARRNDLTAEQRKAVRQVLFFPRRRVDGESVRLDDLVEEGVVGLMQEKAPEMLAAAFSGDPTLLKGRADGLVGKIDWNKLFNWIVENLPKIIEIIMSIMVMF